MQASETRYSLRIETGERQGETLPLHEGLATLGRRSDNTFVLPSGSVSGRHAEIRVENGRVELSDLGSTNGTKVSGRKVESAEVAHGDMITLGSFKLRLLDRQMETGEMEIELEGDDEIQLEEPADPMAKTEFVDPPPQPAAAPAPKPAPTKPAPAPAPELESGPADLGGGSGEM